MAKQMYTFRDFPTYEHIRTVASRYPEFEPASGFGFALLLRVASDFLAAADDYLAEHGLSHGRFIVMMLLYRNVEVPQNPCVLADKAGVTRATMTGLLDGLEREALISRKQVAADRRMLDVALTAKGRKFLDGVMPGYFRLVKRCMGGLEAGEQEEFVSLLTKLRSTAQIGKHPPAPQSEVTR